MERARKKTIDQAAGVTPSLDTVPTASNKIGTSKTSTSKTGTVKRRVVAAKKVADPKVVEAAERSPVETPAATPTAAKTAGRGRAVKAAGATPKTVAKTARMAGSAAPKTPMAKTSKTAVAKAPAAKPTKAVRSKPVAKAVVAKPAASRGVEPLEAGAEIKLGFLAGFVGFHLRLAQDASYRAFSRHRDKDLIKPGRLPALAIIFLNPGISQSALGRAIARDKSTVSPLIKDLQKNGFISRKASTQDRRSVTLALTKKGERTLERLQARAQDHENEIDKIIGASKGRLLSMLDKITTGMAP